MNAGNSANLLQAHFNYRERGMRAMRFTAAIDNRFAPQIVAKMVRTRIPPRIANPLE